ncbi:hypothetical protein [Paenibacillus sp. Soil750]|uniref:hypothetical protein n=1 Tax=Paenibacillus sp. Soil750 TaxID=1736398 RepID=UPI0006F59B58|nr:hypothetical protein [Paenibacillus sp. Soil750]KRE70885.1 hypothetical protein ASL11_11370 [Paenibacillus sp. Soil750]
MKTPKLLTFESWVSDYDWYQYAMNNRNYVPNLLVDRSPCSDPFFDPFTKHTERRPIISGLCRGLKNFSVGDLFIYVTKIDPKVILDLKISSNGTPMYFGVAVLRFTKLYASHLEASRHYEPKQYVAEPEITDYPPNLSFTIEPIVANSINCCITGVSENRENKKTIHRKFVPNEVNVHQWERHYRDYYCRNRDRKLKAGECRVEYISNKECLVLDHSKAPIFTTKDWYGTKPNQKGIQISEANAIEIAKRIAFSNVISTI